MRFLVGILVVFAGLVGYGAYRQRQVELARRERAAALQDSLRRVDSLQRVAEAEAVAAAAATAAAERTAQLAARRADVSGYLERRPERPKPLKIQKPKTRVVVIKPLVRPKRQP